MCHRHLFPKIFWRVSLLGLLTAATPALNAQDAESAASTSVPAPRVVPVPAAEIDFDAVIATARDAIDRGLYADARDQLDATFSRLGEGQKAPPTARYLYAMALFRTLDVNDPVDANRFEKMQADLRSLAEELQPSDGSRPEPLWARVHELLGYAALKAPNRVYDESSRHWRAPRRHFRLALDYWAASTEVEPARQEYLRLVLALASPSDRGLDWEFGQYGERQWLENAVKISRTPEEKSRTQYLLAEWYQRNQQDTTARLRQGDLLQAVVALGKSPYHEQALYELAQWYASFGHLGYNEQGQTQFEPDYKRTVELLRQLLDQYPEGQGRFYRQAQNQLEDLTQPQLDVFVRHTFRPETEVFFGLNWRNLENAEIKVYPTDLLSDNSLEPTGPAIHTQKLDQKPERPHYQVSRQVRLPVELPRGAYVVVASAGGLVRKDRILVTDLVIVTKADADRILAFVTDAETGAPVPEANVELRWGWVEPGTSAEDAVLKEQLKAVTSTNGIAEWKRPEKMRENPEQRSFLVWRVIARKETRQAVAHANQYRYVFQEDTEIQPVHFVYPERPLYRPGETAHWRILSRLRQSDGSYSTPAGDTLSYEIHDAQGEMVQKGDFALDRFGAGAVDYPIPANAPLGSYNVRILQKGVRYARYYELFRVEEFRAPEYRVAVQLGQSKDGAVLLEPGQEVPGEIQVDYYSGGAVGDAATVVQISRQPYVHWFWPMEKSRWLQPALTRPAYHQQPPEVVERIELTTDSRGHATFSFETPQDIDQDWLYTVEVRVQDRSRREIVETRTLKLTRQPYFVQLSTAHRLYQPGDDVVATVETLNANDQPVSIHGQLRLTRERWRQVYIHRRKGNEISGESWRQLPERALIGATQSDYRLKDEGFVTEEVESVELETGEDGKVAHKFKAPQLGYYNLQWISPGARGLSVTQDSPFWVAQPGDVRIGYRPGGVEIIMDEREIKIGEKLPVLITVPTPNRHVWLVRGADSIQDYQVLKFDGRAKLLSLPITAADAPNTGLEASMISGGELFMNYVELVVPPTPQFLDVEVEADAEGYTPGSEARLNLTVKDQSGKPVVGSFSLAMVDASLDSLLPGYEVPDIQKAFYQDKRWHRIQTGSSVQERPFYQPLGDDDDAPAPADEEIYELQGFGGVAARGMAEAAPMMAMDMKAQGAPTASPGDLATPALRQDFRFSAYWSPSVVTNEQGQAQVSVKLPDNLTEWRVTTIGADTGSRVGQAELRTATRLPLIARLNMPRFLYEGDDVVLSGVLNNNTYSPLDVTVVLEVPKGLQLKGEARQKITVPARNSRRLDWSAKALAAGEYAVKLDARSQLYADAVELKLPVAEPLQDRQVTWAGRTAHNVTDLVLQLPKNLDAADPQVRFSVSPTIADSMLGALPYLVNYPYGCTEQTLSRFVPALVVRKALTDLGYEPEQVQRALAERMGWDFVPEESETGLPDLDAVIEQGLKRLYESQLADGSWPWIAGGESDVYMTGYAVWALTLAEQTGLAIEEKRLEQARQFIEMRLMEASSQPALQAWLVQALSARHRTLTNETPGQPSRFEARAFLNLFNQRERLSPQTLAHLALAAVDFGFEREAETLVGMLRNTVKRDTSPSQSILLPVSQTQGANDLPVAYWGERQDWWRWYESGEESTAWALMAMLHADPGNALVDPAMHWLVRSRQAARWSNTRSTAISVLALTEYLLIEGEMDVSSNWSMEVNGQTVAQGELSFNNLLGQQGTYTVPRAALKPGENQLRIRRSAGEVPLYYRVSASYQAGPEDFKPYGFQLFLDRQYLQITAVPTLLQGFKEQILKLGEPHRVASGDRIDVLLRLDAKNNLEYLLIEDPKPAGLETVQQLSGANLVARELDPTAPANAGDDERYTGRTAWVYQELRDRKVALMIPRLPTGIWEIRYRLRAEAPGEFIALPTKGTAMYVPPIEAGTADHTFEVNDKETSDAE
ncbi:MAG: MG2 domain-containing protein [Verrucomicrobiota bacterium JB022]|nr:MG2 domain-containing protein [Verrucomicrobiota bacterium JB022]